MTDAVLSFDVSLDQLDVALRTADTGWQWPHRAYPNNWPGYQQLKTELLVELGQAAATGLTAVAESTGPYWWPAFYQLAQDADLADYQPHLAVLNPQHGEGDFGSTEEPADSSVSKQKHVGRRL